MWHDHNHDSNLGSVVITTFAAANNVLATAATTLATATCSRTIRTGEMTWEEMGKADMTYRWKYMGLAHHNK